MEWMLQVADEFDDAVSALRMFAMAWGAEFTMLMRRGDRTTRGPLPAPQNPLT